MPPERTSTPAAASTPNAATDERAAGRRERPPAPLERRPASPPRVMVIDDEEEFLELAKILLESDGFTVETAHAAGEALWRALQRPPDVVLLDLMMPGADGFETLRALRNDEQTRGALVFACSAIGRPESAPLILGAGFDGHFPKPINWTELRRLLRRLFGL